MSLIKRAALLALPLAIAACHHSNSNFGDENARPDYIKGAIVSNTYDGTSNDLLTAGLGKSGLAGTAPVVAVPTAPTGANGSDSIVNRSLNDTNSAAPTATSICVRNPACLPVYWRS